MSSSQFGDRVRTSGIMRPAAACALALALLLAPTHPATAQDDNPLHTASRTELDVVKVILAQEKAWNAGDIEGYVKAYKDSPATIFIGKDVSKGYAQILEDYKRNYYNRASMGTLTFSELEVYSLSETFAICIGKYHVERAKKDGGPSDGQFSDVLEKTADGWKIVLDHTT
jgi:ketosteroid isomerase-like protein